MSRVSVALLLFLVSSPAFADQVGRSAYWNRIIDILFTTLVNLFFVASIAILVFGGALFIKNINNPQSFSQSSNMTPISILRMFLIIVLAGAMYAPLQAIALFADFAGLVNEGNGLIVCSSVDISQTHINWQNSAGDCIAKAQERMAQLIGFTDSERASTLNIEIVVKLVQFVSLMFFFGSGIKVSRHLMGSRDVKGSVWTGVVAMIASSIMFVLPNVVVYIDDFRGNENVIVDTTG